MREVDYLRQLLRKAREWVDRAEPKSEDQTSEVCLLLQEIDDATAEHEENCRIYDDGQCTCPRPPQPQDTARCSYATPAATQIVYLEKRKAELEAEVERLKAERVERCLNCTSWRAVLQAQAALVGRDIRDARELGFRAGVAAMRETAAKLLDGTSNTPGLAQMPLWADEIRALPDPEDTENK